MNRRKARQIGECIFTETGLTPEEMLKHGDFIMHFISGGEVDRYDDGQWILDMTPSFHWNLTYRKSETPKKTLEELYTEIGYKFILVGSHEN